MPVNTEKSLKGSPRFNRRKEYPPEGKKDRSGRQRLTQQRPVPVKKRLMELLRQPLEVRHQGRPPGPLRYCCRVRKIRRIDLLHNREICSAAAVEQLRVLIDLQDR